MSHWNPETHYGPCTADDGSCFEDGVVVLVRREGGAGGALGEIRFGAAHAGGNYQWVGDTIGAPFLVACAHHAHEWLDQLIRDGGLLRSRALDRTGRLTGRRREQPGEQPTEQPDA